MNMMLESKMYWKTSWLGMDELMPLAYSMSLLKCEVSKQLIV